MSAKLKVRPPSKLSQAPKQVQKIAGSKVVNFLYERSRRRRPVLSQRERERLIMEYRLKARKLARSILRKWHARLDLEEVDSVVDLSLCEAVKRFNPSMGAGFMTFLFYHLRGNLIRAVTAAATCNAVPVHEHSNGKGEVLTRTFHAAEIASALSSSEMLQPDEVVLKRELAELSRGACDKLDNLEREVIHRIYIQGQQLLDIAHSLGYSRCHISRVKRKALETLHGELSPLLGIDTRSPELARASAGDKKIVHRRKPRSKKALQPSKTDRIAKAA